MMCEEALEPKLTKADLRVLAVVPAGGARFGTPRNEPGATATIWQLGEAARTLDLKDLLLTLNGLQTLRYIDCMEFQGGYHESRRWWRTDKGDALIRERAR